MGHDGREAWRIIQELLFEGETHDRIHEVCATFGLTPGLAKALVHLSPDAGIAMRELADHWGCDASYITALVDGLEQRGMAERRPSPGDRRVKAVALTAEGAAAKGRVLDRMWEPPKAFDVLTSDEEAQLRSLLDKVALADPRIRDARTRIWAAPGSAGLAGSAAAG
ncbi:MAG: MarR family winged helix-turn-helix transcriptional regulator [Acidimicrobiales bacterium]